MNKKHYERPELNQEELRVESGIAASAALWYEQGGQGDFDYVITEDETWG